VRERPASSDFKDIARGLPESDDEVPGLPDWRYVLVAGHSPGHVAFFRPSDRVAITGDAVVTAAFGGLLPSWRRISRPLRMVSSDWRRAMESIATLAALEPRVLASGHGVPMAGPAVAGDLRAFSERCSASAARRRT